MQTTQSVEKRPDEGAVYTFKREDGRWYIQLTGQLEQGWNKQDFELAEGEDKVLNVLSDGAKNLCLHLSLEPFEGANVLELVEHCPAPKGGGIYLYNPLGEHHSRLYWICDLALFVFGDIPERMYVERLSLKDKKTPKEQAINACTLQQVQNPAWLKRAV